MQNNYGNPNVVYAGFWVRLCAYCLDSLIVFAGLLVVRMFLWGLTAAAGGTALEGNFLFDYSIKDIILYIFQVLYFILCTWLTGTTLGKRALNLRVVSADQEKLSLLNVVYRETIGRFLCSLSICIGYIIVGIDGQKRGFHDMLCDTRVIYAKKIKVYPVYQMPPVRPAGPMGGGPMPQNGPTGPGMSGGPMPQNDPMGPGMSGGPAPQGGPVSAPSQDGPGKPAETSGAIGAENPQAEGRRAENQEKDS